MAKQSWQHEESSNDDATPPQPTADTESAAPAAESITPAAQTPPAAQDAAEPVTAPRRARRRIDPAGDTLHTVGTGLPQRPTNDDAAAAPSQEPSDAPTQHQPAATIPPPLPGGHAGAPPPSALLTEPLEDSFEDAAMARAKARDRAVVGSPVVAVILQVVLAILAPIAILIGIIRLIASSVFLWFEYHRPGFPADAYGMDTDQRLTLGSYGVDYLFNFAPSAYLGDLRFANGNPVFTESEVGHMADVKQVMLVTSVVGIIAVILCVISVFMLYRMRKGAIARSLFAGAVWFTAAIIIVAVVAALGWEAFFANFHQLFFADGTWTFAATDTLIRLYPSQFWVDAAAWIAGLTLVTMVVILVVTAPTGRRRYRNAQAQRFMESQVTGAPKVRQP